MTPIGKTRCLLCGKVSGETVFYASPLSASIAVGRSRTGRYRLFAKSDGREVAAAWLSERPEVHKDSGQITKIVGALRFRDDEHPHPFLLRSRNRVCPHCLERGTVTQLPPGAGLAPAFLIGVAGLPGTGKSVLLRSAFTGKSVMAIRQALGSFRLEAGMSSEYEVPEATQLAQSDPMHLLKVLRVVDPQGKLTALIYLKDSPGELFDPEKFGTESWEKHFAPFVHADAMLYVMDHHAVQAAGAPPPQQTGDPHPFLQELPRSIPTAVVLTKADKLADHLPLHSRDGQRLLLNRASPIFQKTSPQLEAVSQRMALDRQLLLELVPYLSLSPLAHSEQAGYFTLSSGVDGPKGSFDYAAGYNQFLPFLFLLNAMGLGCFAGKEAG
ncbi:MAG TPA: GTPase domain-containing protein [Candidatus Evtepia faecigallinarum]|nr:GTPase domain-containing protein [Candidatus Evtepia faecigallinarum]